MGFVFVTIILSFVASLLLLDRFRSHEATLDLIVLSRSGKGAIEAPAVRDVLMLLASQDDFLYAVNDTAVVSSLTVSQTGATSFRIHAVSDTPLDARDGAVAASQELFTSIGKYYDIRSDISVRSIGSPKTRAVVVHPVLLIGSGIFFAVIISIAFFAILLLLVRIAFSVRGREVNPSSAPVFPLAGEDMIPYEEAPPVFSPEMFVPKKQENTFFSFEPSSVTREKGYAHFNRGPAPANLPIAMDELDALPDFLLPVKTAGADMPVKSEISEEKTVPSVPASDIAEPNSLDTPLEALSIDHEPTPEEYKRRLNELLSGKMPK
jgi:hypothetical protein